MSMKTRAKGSKPVKSAKIKKEVNTTPEVDADKVLADKNIEIKKEAIKIEILSLKDRLSKVHDPKVITILSKKVADKGIELEKIK